MTEQGNRGEQAVFCSKTQLVAEREKLCRKLGLGEVSQIFITAINKPFAVMRYISEAETTHLKMQGVKVFGAHQFRMNTRFFWKVVSDTGKAIITNRRAMSISLLCPDREYIIPAHKNACSFSHTKMCTDDSNEIDRKRNNDYGECFLIEMLAQEQLM